MPLLRKMPKRGFNNAAFKKLWGIVNLRDLEQFVAGTVVDEAVLRERHLIRGKVDGIKILGNGDITKALVLKVDAISSEARKKIINAGGVVALTTVLTPA